MCDCLLLARLLEDTEIPGSGTDNQDWGAVWEEATPSVCAVVPGHAFRKHSKNLSFDYLFVHYQGQSECEEQQKTPLHVGYTPRVKPCSSHNTFEPQEHSFPKSTQCSLWENRF